MEAESSASHLMVSWFDRTYQYRIEQGDLRYSPSKIEAVRRDGEDFDDLSLQILKAHLRATAFPPAVFDIIFETDEFRRYVRIYVDSAQNSHSKKRGRLRHWAIIPKTEIQSRISNAG
jgi:hypothetical protein